MATANRAKIITRTLNRLQLLGLAQSNDADDGELVGEALDAVHDGLRPRGLAPWATSAVPEYAQFGFIEIVAGTVAPFFGLGERPDLVKSGETILRTQERNKRRRKRARVKRF